MSQIFFKSLKDNFSWKFWKFFLGSYGAVAGVLLIGKNFFEVETIEKSILYGIILLLVIGILRFMAFFSKNSYAYWQSKENENVYGYAIIILNDAFAKAHWLRKHETLEEKKRNDFLRGMCAQLKLIYDNKTKTNNCAVSIKVPIYETDIKELDFSTKIKNLCRDRSSAMKRDTDIYRETQHIVFQNTCYIDIVEKLTNNVKEKLYYLNNNISKTENYKNTSKQCHENGILPYNSELVVPIIPLYTENETLYKVVGFICVDSPESNVFNALYDVALLQGVADGIYDFLKPDLKKISTT